MVCAAGFADRPSISGGFDFDNTGDLLKLSTEGIAFSYSIGVGEVVLIKSIDSVLSTLNMAT